VDNGSTASYVYNAQGQRVEKNVGGTYTEYFFDAGGGAIGENNRSAWTDGSFPFAGRHIAHYQNGAADLIHVNNIGTTEQVTDYTGAVVQDELHYPWGQAWLGQATVEERFAGMQHRDGEMGFDPTYYRMYNSTIYRHFPDLCRQIERHYAAYRVRRVIARKGKAAQEVRRITWELHAKRVRLTRQYIRPLLNSSACLNLEEGQGGPAADNCPDQLRIDHAPITITPYDRSAANLYFIFRPTHALRDRPRYASNLHFRPHYGSNGPSARDQRH
jgi:hypothetical protein